MRSDRVSWYGDSDPTRVNAVFERNRHSGVPPSACYTPSVFLVRAFDRSLRNLTVVRVCMVTP